MKSSLIIFAKEPEQGKVKTRLSVKLSKKECADLYKAFLKDTLDIARKIRCNEKIVAYESGNDPLYLKKAAKGFRFYRQKGRDLGEKMYNAFRFTQGKTVIIGSDSPDLPPCFIESAFHELDENDVVLGPARDGGYYLIGAKNVCFGLFKGVKWSSDEVLASTLKNARSLGKKVVLLNIWHDVDDPMSLAHLKRALKKDKKASKWTRRSLKI